MGESGKTDDVDGGKERAEAEADVEQEKARVCENDPRRADGLAAARATVAEVFDAHRRSPT